MTYILIYWIVACSSCASPLITSMNGQAEFGDLPSCQAALKQIENDFSQKNPSGYPYGVAGGICAQKSGVVPQEQTKAVPVQPKSK